MSGELLPKRDKDSGRCEPDCPFLKQWDHPYWHHSAWCWKQMRELHFYDYYLADCIDNKPDHTMVKHRRSGRTAPP